MLPYISCVVLVFLPPRSLATHTFAPGTGSLPGGRPF
jgi:hypothetical protein